MEEADDPEYTSQIVKDHGPCLECIDERGDAVLLPFNRRGVIYEVAEAYPDQPLGVYRAQHVTKASPTHLPRLVTLVHGDPPVLNYAFTGVLRLYSVFTEETILAGTLDDPTSICLELSTDSAAKFRLALNENTIKKTCEYMNASHICETFGPKFVRGIKVAFPLLPEDPEGLGDATPTNETTPPGGELGNMDAGELLNTLNSLALDQAGESAGKAEKTDSTSTLASDQTSECSGPIVKYESVSSLEVDDSLFRLAGAASTLDVNADNEFEISWVAPRSNSDSTEVSVEDNDDAVTKDDNKPTLIVRDMFSDSNASISNMKNTSVKPGDSSKSDESNIKLAQNIPLKNRSESSSTNASVEDNFKVDDIKNKSSNSSRRESNSSFFELPDCYESIPKDRLVPESSIEDNYNIDSPMHLKNTLGSKNDLSLQSDSVEQGMSRGTLLNVKVETHKEITPTNSNSSESSTGNQVMDNPMYYFFKSKSEAVPRPLEPETSANVNSFLSLSPDSKTNNISAENSSNPFQSLFVTPKKSEPESNVPAPRNKTHHLVRNHLGDTLFEPIKPHNASEKSLIDIEPVSLSDEEEVISVIDNFAAIKLTSASEYIEHDYSESDNSNNNSLTEAISQTTEDDGDVSEKVNTYMDLFTTTMAESEECDNDGNDSNDDCDDEDADDVYEMFSFVNDEVIANEPFNSPKSDQKLSLVDHEVMNIDLPSKETKSHKRSPVSSDEHMEEHSLITVSDENEDISKDVNNIIKSSLVKEMSDLGNPKEVVNRRLSEPSRKHNIYEEIGHKSKSNQSISVTAGKRTVQQSYHRNVGDIGLNRNTYKSPEDFTFGREDSLRDRNTALNSDHTVSSICLMPINLEACLSEPNVPKKGKTRSAKKKSQDIGNFGLSKANQDLHGSIKRMGGNLDLASIDRLPTEKDLNSSAMKNTFRSESNINSGLFKDGRHKHNKRGIIHVSKSVEEPKSYSGRSLNKRQGIPEDTILSLNESKTVVESKSPSGKSGKIKNKINDNIISNPAPSKGVEANAYVSRPLPPLPLARNVKNTKNDTKIDKDNHYFDSSTRVQLTEGVDGENNVTQQNDEILAENVSDNGFNFSTFGVQTQPKKSEIIALTKTGRIKGGRRGLPLSFSLGSSQDGDNEGFV